ncbi:ribonuclease T2 family protein [Candidatus Methylocalor cossyra]|uniref:Ribonuclease T2 n=1 Tax=Candidatus Methylocalor cossyra TaxID=3108543 RepID=A0ABP1C601_9GAMM
MSLRTALIVSTALLLGLGSLPEARAELGDFMVTRDCPAVSSLRRGTNPGGVRVAPAETYTAITRNKAGGDFVLLRIPTARPNQRWVALDCGLLQNVAESGATPPAPAGQSRPGQFLLAASWQPAFCETPEGQGKQECATAGAGRFDADHFTLHGLWPQPPSNIYCRVPPRERADDERHDWEDLPEPALSSATRAELDQVMPGTASHLDRHEWIKHGTCYGTGPEAYFRTALALLKQVNESRLRAWMASHIGAAVSATELKAAFEESFGPGSGRALGIECSRDGDRLLISGITLNLRGPLRETASLGEVLDSSVAAKSECARGWVDAVGPD